MRSYITHNSLLYIYIYVRAAPSGCILYFSWSQSLWLSKSSLWLCLCPRVRYEKEHKKKREREESKAKEQNPSSISVAQQSERLQRSLALFFIHMCVMLCLCAVSEFLVYSSHMIAYMSFLCDRTFSRLGSRSFSFPPSLQVIKNNSSI